MLRKVTKKVLELVYKPIVARYLKSDRPFSYGKLNLIISKGVFHPGFFNSSIILANFTSKLNLQNKNLIEIGSGSGLISLVAASKGAFVTAIDLNPAAVKCSKSNADRNGLKIDCFQSDLFKSVSPKTFDFIIINPPYFPKNPTSPDQLAWFCGENHAYFEQFFSQLSQYQDASTEIYMILSEDVDVKSIEQIAIDYNFELRVISSHYKGLEWNSIYGIFKS